MGVLFSTPDNWMMHQTERFVKGTGKFLSRTGERFVRSEASQSVKSGAIGRGFDRIGESISRSARKTANFAHNVTQKGRNLLRKKNKINNYSYQQLPPNANKQNKNTNPELHPPNAKKNAAANNAAAKKDVNNNSYISPASSELTQPTVSNTANKPKNVTNLVVKPNSVKNSGSTVQNTSSTKAANNEMYSSILKKLEGLKEDMKKKVDEDFRNRISKPGSKPVTISQIGGPNFTRLIKLFLIIQKLRNNNNNNTKKLELDLKELLELKVIDKKSKKPKNPEDLLEEYKTEISKTPIDVLKKEFNEECKELFPYYTRIDESEIPQINSPNNNAKSNTNTVVGNNNQSNLTKELKNLNSKSKTLSLPVDHLQPAITSGGSRKKSKKSRS